MLFNHATKVICEPLLLIKYLVGRRINYTIGLKGNENYIFSMVAVVLFDDISCHYIAKINVYHIASITVWWKQSFIILNIHFIWNDEDINTNLTKRITIKFLEAAFD